ALSTLSLHDALPISAPPGCGPRRSAAASRCGHHRRQAADAGTRSAPALAARRIGALPASYPTALGRWPPRLACTDDPVTGPTSRSEEHTSELQSREK